MGLERSTGILKVLHNVPHCGDVFFSQVGW